MTMTSTSSKPGLTTTPHSQYDVDERIAARNAVELTSEKWRSLVTDHASTFVAADRRNASIQEALLELLLKIDRETRPFVVRVGKALDCENKNESKRDMDEEGKRYHDEDDDDTGPIQPASVLLADLADKHRLRRRMLVHHSSLLELLELPSLMDACVRSSLYDDALSIAGFANTLEKRHLLEQGSFGRQKPRQQTHENASVDDDPHPGNRPQQEKNEGDVISGVVFEIRRRESDLRRMLIHRLRQDVTMPQCLEVVTALRRLNGVELERRNSLNSFAGSVSGTDSAVVASDSLLASSDLEGVHAAMEMRLEVDFLEARDAWLEAGMTKIGSLQAAASLGDRGGSTGTSVKAEQILDDIERYRTRFFDIVTQFLAIFRGSIVPSSAADSPSNNGHDHSYSLLSMWTARRVQTFLTTLRFNLETYANDTATLRDALDAASFFASSMARVGADFQPLLAPIFESRLLEIISGLWNDGLSSMVDSLKVCMDAGIAGPLVGTETSLNTDGGNGIRNDAIDRIEIFKSSRTPAPPRKLLALPLLARFLNAYIGGLNELRRCLITGVFPAVRLAHRKLVNDAKMALQTNERSALTPGLRGEAVKLREMASKMKVEFDDCLEPYMNRCLEVALGSFDYAIAEGKAAATSETEAVIATEEMNTEEYTTDQVDSVTEKEVTKVEDFVEEKSIVEVTESANVSDDTEMR